MKTIGTTNYYSKEEVAALIGCSINTINVRICAAKVHGSYFGRHKYYTEDQIKIIAEYRKDA